MDNYFIFLLQKEDDSVNIDHNEGGVLKSVRRKWRGSNDNKSASTIQGNNEKLRSLLYRVAYKHLTQGEWKRLALHWAFTDEQIRAIEHQYTGKIDQKIVLFYRICNDIRV